MKHILIFGSSTVHGVGGQQGWADQLKAALHAEMFANGGTRAYEIYELGIPGTSLQDMQARFEAELKARLPEHVRPEDIYVVFSAGTNDSVAVDEPGHHVRSADDFAALAHAYIHLIKDYTDHILAVGVTPVDESKTTPFTHDGIVYVTNERLAAFEAALQEVAGNENVTCVPLHGSVPADWPATSLFADGLHPNDAGHQWIASKVEPVLREMLA
jgi:lysophospholipase L1-like esterase